MIADGKRRKSELVPARPQSTPFSVVKKELCGTNAHQGAVLVYANSPNSKELPERFIYSGSLFVIYLFSTAYSGNVPSNIFAPFAA